MTTTLILNVLLDLLGRPVRRWRFQSDGVRIGWWRRLLALCVAMMTALVASLVLGVADSAAVTTSVYYDANNNVSIDPTPFGAHIPSGDGNSELGLNGLQNLTSGFYNVASGYDDLHSDTRTSRPAPTALSTPPAARITPPTASTPCTTTPLDRATSRSAPAPALT